MHEHADWTLDQMWRYSDDVILEIDKLNRVVRILASSGPSILRVISRSSCGWMLRRNELLDAEHGWSKQSASLFRFHTAT